MALYSQERLTLCLLITAHILLVTSKECGHTWKQNISPCYEK